MNLPELTLDTGIIVTLWSRDEQAETAAQILTELQRNMQFTVSPIVFAELQTHPSITHSKLVSSLQKMNIRYDNEFTKDMFELAGERFANYAERCRRMEMQTPKRPIVDFLIGAYASCRSKHLLTIDASKYNFDFPELTVFALNS